jgi:hypothetical protein
VWSDLDNFPCPCPPSNSTTVKNSLACCARYRAGSNYSTAGCEGAGDYATSTEAGGACIDNFSPLSLNVTFDEVPGDDVIRAIVASIPGYLREMFANESAVVKSPFGRYNVKAVVDSWNWEGLRETARADGIYASHAPVVEYSAGEAGSPFRDGTSVWRMCAGLISQIMMTMPLAPLALTDQESMVTVSTVPGLRAQNLKFDPTNPKNGNSVEAYVERLLADSFAHAPTFWHYAAR